MVIAYFDPGPGSLLVQAIAAGSAGLVVFLRYLWQKYRVSSNGLVRSGESSEGLKRVDSAKSAIAAPGPALNTDLVAESAAISCEADNSSGTHPCFRC